MNPHDGSDERLAAAFRARLESAPEPPDATFARTMAAITAAPQSRSLNLRSATRWWSALAAPARLATASAIVIVGGTIAFGTLKATHERVIATDTAPARLSLDRAPQADRLLARSGSMQIVVHDIASAARRISELTHHERGEVVSQQLVGPAQRPAARARILLRIRANRLDATMNALTALGRIDSRAIETVDLTRAVEETATALGRAAREAQTASSGSVASEARAAALAADIARLTARRRELERRTATATLAIVLRAADSGPAAFSAVPNGRSEPLPGSLRPTCSLLARGPRFVPHDPELARRCLRPFDLAASRALAAASPADGAPTDRNDRPHRV